MILAPDGAPIHDTLVSFHDDVGTGSNAGLIIEHTQEIPDEHLSALRLQRAESLNTPMGTFHKVCSIPTGVVEELKRRYGLDVMTADIRDILNGLRKYELDKFITTNRRI